MNRLLSTREHGIAPLLVWVALLAFVAPIRAQTVVLHDGFAADDGNAARDADGLANGVAVWAGDGTVHVVRKGFEVRNGQRLVVRPGAVVKFVDEWTLDAQGRLLAAAPTKDGYLRTVLNTVDLDQRRPVIEIERATLTDIRDDTYGGDTNRDGASTKPAWIAFELGFADSPSRLVDSVVRFGWMDRLGFASVLRNRFDYFGGICPRATFEDVGGAPVVEGNTFNLAFPAGCSELDFRGASPIIIGNTIRTVPMLGYQGETRTTGLVIGPCCVFDPRGPMQGTTVVAYNDIEARTAIRMPWQAGSTMYQQIDFRAVIHGNTLRGIAHPSAVLPGDDGLMLVLEADVRVARNTVSNFRNPLVFQATGATPIARPRLSHNTFSIEGATATTGASIPEATWRSGVYLDAERNDWGHDSGPLDESAADGLANPRGRGVRLGNGVDYVPVLDPGRTDTPFVGLEVTAGAGPVLTTGAEASFVPRITRLSTGAADRGALRIVVRDDEGVAIRSGESLPVTTGALPRPAAVSVTVPKAARFLSVEAVFTRSDGGPTVVSDPVYFVVDRPESRIGFRIVRAASTNPLWPVVGPARGVTAAFTAGFPYELAREGGGRIEISMTEIDQRTGASIATPLFSPGSVRLPNTVRGTAQAEMTIKLALRDVVLDRRPAALRIHLRLRDAADAVVAEESFRLSIDESSNFVRIRSFVPGEVDGSTFASSGTPFHAEGARPDGQLSYTIQAGSPNPPHLWQLFREASAIGADGRSLRRWQPTLSLRNLFSTTRLTETVLLAHEEPIPAGTVRVRHRLWVWSPYYRVNLAEDTLDVAVRMPSARQTLELTGTGTGRLAFTQTPVTLDLSVRPSTGSVTVDEFAGAWEAPSWIPFETSPWPEGFVSIGRHWTVQATGAGTWGGTITFAVDPFVDLPAGVGEDSLVVAAFNPITRSVEVLATAREAAAHTVTAEYGTLFETWLVGTMPLSPVRNETESPTDFRLEPAYPNPFNPVTQIPFAIGSAGNVRLSVYDAIGRRVADLVAGELPAGPHRATWDATGRASGTYWIRLVAPGGTRTRAVVLLR